MIAAARKMSPRVAILVGLVAVAVLIAAAAFGASTDASGLPGANVARIVIGTIVAFGLLVLAARFLPRIGAIGGMHSGSFRVVAALSVGQRERVVIVQVGEQQMMLGVSPGRVGMLQQLDVPLPEREAGAAMQTGVTTQTWINRVMGKES